MKSFPKTTPTWWDGLVVAGIVAVALVCSAWLAQDQSGPLQAVVSAQGTQIATISLTKGDGVYPFSAQGYSLALTVDQGEVWVSQADCPTQDCVHTGHIHSAGQSIVCLPAQISIRLVGGGQSDVDVVVG